MTDVRDVKKAEMLLQIHNSEKLMKQLEDTIKIEMVAMRELVGTYDKDRLSASAGNFVNRPVSANSGTNMRSPNVALLLTSLEKQWTEHRTLQSLKANFKRLDN